MKEAEYIVEVLVATREQLKAKYERYEQLKQEMFFLKKRLWIEGYTFFKAEYKPKKAEYEKLKSESMTIYYCLNLHEKLIAKYSAIANREPHDGRYKHLSLERLGVLFPKEPITHVIA
jgi:hypothetical protein